MNLNFFKISKFKEIVLPERLHWSSSFSSYFLDISSNSLDIVYLRFEMHSLDIHFGKSNYWAGSTLGEENIFTVFRYGLRMTIVLAQVTVSDSPDKNSCFRVDIDLVIIDTHAEDKFLALILSNIIKLI